MGKMASFLVGAGDHPFAVGLCILGLSLCIAAPGSARAEIPFQHVVVDDDGPMDMHSKGIGDINGDGFPDLVPVTHTQ